MGTRTLHHGCDNNESQWSHWIQQLTSNHVPNCVRHTTCVPLRAVDVTPDASLLQKTSQLNNHATGRPGYLHTFVHSVLQRRIRQVMLTGVHLHPTAQLARHDDDTVC